MPLTPQQIRQLNRIAPAANKAGLGTLLSNLESQTRPQGSPFDFSANATLTAVHISIGIITKSGTAAVTLTLPTGPATEALAANMAIDASVDFVIINTNATGAVTLAPSTGHTIVGSAAVAVSSSARFRIRKVADGVFVTYRIA